MVPSPMVELPVAKMLVRKEVPETVSCVVDACCTDVCPVTVKSAATVEDASERKPPVNVWSWLQLFAVVVPNASERLLPEKTMG